MTTDQAKQLITSVLTTLGYNTPPFVNLLTGTMAQESSMGIYEQQIGGGPALGIFMTEPATWQDIQTNFLAYHSALSTTINSLITDSPPSAQSVVNNHPYACAIAACSYIRHHVPLPSVDPEDVNSMYILYKTYYNSSGGAATQTEFTNNWNSFGI